MPAYAKRRDIVTPKTVLTATEALKEFPVGTKVVREVDAGFEIERKSYEWGTIAGYSQPWWRARYGPEDWEDLNRTEVRRAIQLRAAVEARGLLPNDDGTPTLDTPWRERAVRACPKTLTPECTGSLLCKKFNTGWNLGTVGRHMADKPRLTMEVHFEGEAGPRDVHLRPDLYSAAQDAPEGSWYFLK